MANKKQKYYVEVTKSSMVTGWVWATDEMEAERIAEAEWDEIEDQCNDYTTDYTCETVGLDDGAEEAAYDEDEGEWLETLEDEAAE